MKAFLDHFAAILGALTLALLLTSIVHEYGYFWMIGRNFQTLLATSDYLTNAVLWLPWVLFVVLGNLRGFYSKPPKWWTVGDWRGWKAKLALTLAILLLVWNVVLSEWPPNAMVILYFVMVIAAWWSRVYTRFYWPVDGLDEINSIYRKVLLVGPPFLLAVFFFGWMQGGIDVESTSDPYLVKFKDREHAEPRILLRSFDRGLLMRNAVSNRVEFHKWDEVVTLERVSGKKENPLLCRLFFITSLCADKTPISSP
jgi:hypothetical protein